MSDYERHVGKLIKLDLQGKTKEEFFKELCVEKFNITDKTNWNWEYNYNRNVDDGDDLLYSDHKGNVYKVLECKQEEDSDYISQITPNEDGTFSFIMKFYNGGTCLSEMLEEAIEKL